MQVKKRHLETLFNVLKGTEGMLNLADSRRRDAFMKQVSEEYKTFNDDLAKIYSSFCKKKEDGSLETTMENDMILYHFDPKDTKKVQEEKDVLLNEEVSIEGDVKDLLEKSEYKPKVGEAELIDELLK